VFECFAGYGTTTFALKQLGVEHELIGFSEIDKYAIQCFQQNHGGINYGDITKINWKEVPDFDLLTGGFPCQAFSTAGKQLGEADARGVLGLELTKALVEKKPKYFLFENVKGFMSKKFKETREKFIDSWSKAGYVVQYKVLNTKDFGVPQNRERVWFVGIRKDIQKEFKFPEPFELKLKLKDILEENVDDKYYASERLIEGLKKSNYRERQPMNIDSSVSGALKIGGDPKRIIGCAIRSYPRTGNNDKNREQRLELNGKEESNCLSSSQKDYMIVIDAFNNTIPKNQNISTTIRTNWSNGNAQIMTTLTQATGNRAGSSKEYIKHVNRVAEVSNQVRRLTPKECFRLQGFLNDEINLDGLSDTQKYKLAGNGQSVNVVKLILKELV
jgi:DNA (cytosine-5)-methyltransferase 1